jgi:hypothetical protein
MGIGYDFRPLGRDLDSPLDYFPEEFAGRERDFTKIVSKTLAVLFDKTRKI